MVSDSGPTRPANIISITISLDTKLSRGVMLHDRPTVAIALVVSNSTSSNGWDSSIENDSTAVDISTIRSIIRNIDMARSVSESGSALRPMRTWPRPRICENTSAASTATVVVFTPPPVEAGDAPMNMNMVVISLLGACICSWSIVAKPAVRVVTD